MKNTNNMGCPLIYRGDDVKSKIYLRHYFEMFLLLSLSMLLFDMHNLSHAVTTNTQTCTVNGVLVDCETGIPISGGSTVASRQQLCPERVYEPIYGKYCDHKITNLSFFAVKISHAYGGGGFNEGAGLTEAYDMNDNGDIAGCAITSSGDKHAVRVPIGAQYFSDHYFSDLGVNGLNSCARAINNLLTLAGNAQHATNDGLYYDTLWQSQIGMYYPMYALGSQGGVSTDIARDRYYTEKFTGYAMSSLDNKVHGFGYTFDGNNIVKHRIGGNNQVNYAFSINDTGIVAGAIYWYGYWAAYNYNLNTSSGRVMSHFGGFTVANAINNNATPITVGYAWDSDPNINISPVTWKNNNISRLPNLAGEKVGVAYDITDAGDIVGYSGSKATFWRNNVVYDLNTRLANSIGTSLQIANAINRHGRILAKGENNAYYVLIPTESF